MGLPRLFKLPSYNKFQYYPRHFDPRKEELEKRKRIIEHELDSENQELNSEFKGGFRKDGYFYKRVKAEKRSNIRLVVIMAVLMFIAYYLLYM